MRMYEYAYYGIREHACSLYTYLRYGALRGAGVVPNAPRMVSYGVHTQVCMRTTFIVHVRSP